MALFESIVTSFSLLILMIGSVIAVSWMFSSFLDVNNSRVNSFYGGIIKMWSFTFNPTVPDKGVNVVTDFSLTQGEYKTLRSTPVGFEAKKSQSESGFIVELTKSEQPDSKFVLFYSDETDFFDELDNMKKQDLDNLDDIVSGVLGSRTVACWNCGVENYTHRSQPGDEIRFITNHLGVCSTPVTSDSEYICEECCRNVHKQVLDSDASVVRNSDAVLREL